MASKNRSRKPPSISRASTPQIPGSFPVESPIKSSSSSASSSVMVHELLGDSIAPFNVPKFDRRSSNLKAPFDPMLPEYAETKRGKAVSFVPVQKYESVWNEKVPNYSMPSDYSIPSGHSMPSGNSMPNGSSMPNDYSMPNGSSMPYGYSMPTQGISNSIPSGYSMPTQGISNSIPSGYSMPNDYSMPTNYSIPSGYSMPNSYLSPTGVSSISEPEKVTTGKESSTIPLKEPKHMGIPSATDIVIAVFGLTGSGRSSFISKLTGKDIKISHGLQSCTSEIEEVQFKIGLCNVTLVDTPGFDDSNRTDTEILMLIASWMKDAYDDKTRLTGIIFLHRISDNKMSGSSYKNLKMFRSLCGSQNLSHVILATTMWDKVTPEEGTQREAELLSEDKWWGEMRKKGSLVRRYDNTKGGAMAMVNELLQMSPIVLTIQNEIAVQKKQLADTMVGRSINADLKNLSKRYEEDLAEVQVDLALAMKEKDNALQKELEKTKKKLVEQIASTNQAKSDLLRPINRRAWWKSHWTCSQCEAKLTRSRRESAMRECPGCGFGAIIV